jgi:hypothetical protein
MNKKKILYISTMVTLHCAKIWTYWALLRVLVGFWDFNAELNKHNQKINCVCVYPINNKKEQNVAMGKLYISVVADDEVRFISDTKATAQKLLSENPQADPAIYWSPRWVREIVSYLITCDYLQQRYRTYINYLIVVACSKPEFPDHIALVKATKLLLGKWTYDCGRDDTCLAPPSRRMLADNEIKKVLTSYATMQRAIVDAKGNVGISALDSIITEDIPVAA